MVNPAGLWSRRRRFESARDYWKMLQRSDSVAANHFGLSSRGLGFKSRSEHLKYFCISIIPDIAYLTVYCVPLTYHDLSLNQTRMMIYQIVQRELSEKPYFLRRARVPNSVHFSPSVHLSRWFFNF